MIKKNKKAITIIELIIVITILSILAVIWLLSYQSYTIYARDSNRLISLDNLHSWISLYQIKNLYVPIPDSYITISLSWTLISYQWLVWTWVLPQIRADDIKDPMDSSYYTYVVNSSKNAFQLLWYLEDASNLAISSTNTTYAATDYTTRTIKTVWASLWVFFDPNTNTPITTNIDLFLAQSGTTYKVIVKDKVAKTLKGMEIWGWLQSLSIKQWLFTQPSNCDTWFIPVPWNPDFMQPGFCAAKYEMTYADATNPNSTWWWTDWNTMHYTWAKTPVSQAWLYPIADLTQQQAIDSCKLIWWHLITNNEWMTIARNIESQSSNWSNWVVWSWYINNWISNSLNMWCGLWTTDTIYILPKSYWAKTWEWSSWHIGSTAATDCDKKRKNILSNWQEIYDISGNLWEHVNKANTIDWSFYNMGQTTFLWSSNWFWWDDDGKYDSVDMLKNSSLYLYWISNWIWNLNFSNWAPNNVFIRWSDVLWGDNTWIYAINLAWTSTTSYRYTWFRCVKY